MQHMQVTVHYRVEGDHAHFRAEMTKSAPAIASIAGLVRHMWSLDPDSGLGTSVYLFESEAAARRFLAGPTLEHLLNGPGVKRGLVRPDAHRWRGTRRHGQLHRAVTRIESRLLEAPRPA